MELAGVQECTVGGKRLDHYEKKRKKEARSKHKASEMSQKLRGIKAKLYHKKRCAAREGQTQRCLTPVRTETVCIHSIRTSKRKIGTPPSC